VTAAQKIDPFAYPPRGLSREEAARYIGVGTSKFDQLVHDGRMPRGKRIDGRIVWDRIQLDVAFTDLDSLAENTIDAALREGRRRA
jgi:excisionase family DNA binding protein